MFFFFLQFSAFFIILTTWSVLLYVRQVNVQMEHCNTVSFIFELNIRNKGNVLLLNNLINTISFFLQ